MHSDGTYEHHAHALPGRLCNLVKSLDQFHVNNSNADKRDTRCKMCCQDYEKEKRAKKQRQHQPTVVSKSCRCLVGA